MANSLKLFINPESQRLLANASALTSAQSPVFYSGNELSVELHLISGVGVARIPYEVPFPAGCNIKFSVGSIAKLPTGGDWMLSVDSVNTAELDYNATALQVQTALNNIVPVSSNGGVSVEKLGFGYSITWNTTGTKPEILAGADTLTPSSYESIYKLQTGDLVNREIVFVELRQSPVALSDSFTPIGVPVVTSTVVQTWNGSNKVVRVAISPAPQNGTYNIKVGSHSATVNAISDNIDIRSALRGAGATSVVNVSQTGNLQYDISLSSDQTVTVDGSGLVQSSGYTGTVSFATSEAIAFLGSNPTAEAVLEIIVESAGINTTVCQVSCTLANGILATGAIEPLTFGTILTESVANSRFLRKDLVEAPSLASQDIIWQNLGVTADGSNSASAISNSENPSSGNPFLTLSDGNTRYAPFGFNPFDQTLNTIDDVRFSKASFGVADNFEEIIVANDGITIKNEGILYGTIDRTGLYLGNMKYGSNSIKFDDGTFQYTAAYNPDLTPYLLSSVASTTYATIASLASYLTISSASATYALLSSFDQQVLTTSDVLFNSVNIASGGCLITPDPIYSNPAISLSSGWKVTIQGGGGDTILDWDGLTINGTTGLNLTGGGSITFADYTTQNTRVVREQQPNGSGFSTGGFDTAHYPYEVKVISDTGIAYWVPARLA